MPGDGDRRGRGRGKRAAAACEWCRQKKLKCDTGQPRCGNCAAHGRDCVQVVYARKPRPTKKRIADLEEENRRLRQSSQLRTPTQLDDFNGITQDARSCEDPVGTSGPARQHYENFNDDFERHPADGNVPKSPGLLDIPQATPEDYHAEHIASPEVPERSESRYHGPTSAMFDGQPSSRRQSESAPQAQPVPDELIKCVLLANAARQRQLETINLISEKLDFDGVNPDLGIYLLSIFWSRQHHSGLIVYRPAFMRDMACAGPFFSKLLLNAIFFAASKHSRRLEVRSNPDDITTAGWSYRTRFKSLLMTSFDSSSVTTIQALLIMANSLFSRCDERSLSWLYAGNAFNMIIDLGLQIEPGEISLEKAETVEVKRRLLWGAFGTSSLLVELLCRGLADDDSIKVLDKIQALYQGRPPNLHESDCDIPLSFLDEYEELEFFHPISYTDGATRAFPAYNISVFREFCKLSLIMDRILTQLYAAKSTTRNPDELLQESRSLNADLENWSENLPAHMVFSDALGTNATLSPHTLSLLALYNTLVILLHRPLVSDGHLHSSSPKVVYNSFVTCAAAATKIAHILRAYERMYVVKSAPYLLSYAIYISATIHVRIVAQSGPGSEAAALLKTCLETLEEHQRLYSAARRAKLVVQSLSRRMGVDISSAAHTSLAIQAEDSCTSSRQPIGQNGEITPSGAAIWDTGMQRDVPQSSNSATLGDSFNDFYSFEFDMDVVVQSFSSDNQMTQQYGSIPQPNTSEHVFRNIGTISPTLESIDPLSSSSAWMVEPPTLYLP